MNRKPDGDTIPCLQDQTVFGEQVGLFVATLEQVRYAEGPNPVIHLYVSLPSATGGWGLMGRAQVLGVRPRGLHSAKRRSLPVVLPARRDGQEARPGGEESGSSAPGTPGTQGGQHKQEQVVRLSYLCVCEPRFGGLNGTSFE